MIGRRSLLILLNNVLGGFFGFFALKFVLALPPGSLGAYAWASATLGIAALVTSFGFPQAHIKRVNEGRDEATANATFFLIKLTLTTIFAVLTLGGYLVWKLVLGRGFTDATTEPIFVTCVAIYVLLSLRQFFDTVFLTHQHTARAESVLFVDTVTSVFSVVVAYSLWAVTNGRNPPLAGVGEFLVASWGIDRPLTADDAGLLLALAYCLGRGVSLVYAGLQFLVHRYPLSHARRDVYDSYKVLGFPLAIVAGLGVLYANIDRFFLGYFHEAAEVARFSAPLQILTPMLFVSTAVSTLLFPQFSRLDASGAHDKIRLQIHQSQRYMSMLLLPMLVLAFVFAREGINIFNEQYVDQANVLRILLVYVFFSVLASPSRMLLLGLGRPRRLLLLGLINVVVVTALILVLVPTWALDLRSMGAAIAAAAASIITYVYVKRQTRDVVGADYVPRGLVRQLVAATLVLAAASAVRASLGAETFHPWYALVAAGVGAGLLYVGLLFLLKEFRKEDFDFFLDLLHPGKMAGYVGDEMRPTGSEPRSPGTIDQPSKGKQ
ncbi:MAG: polysaccharide biosynthesis C-terminal domain-containing protein [Euryarchaeota archaeon]|nr:polysaccharide biosynthesis C-terminal domain-containing protein [Euryarchaeota archaeon]